MSLTNVLFTELSSFSSECSSVYWTGIRGFTPVKLFCSKTKHQVKLCFSWIRRWTMSVALRIHSSLCKITRICSRVSKYWIVFRGLHKSKKQRSQLSSSLALGHIITQGPLWGLLRSAYQNRKEKMSCQRGCRSPERTKNEMLAGRGSGKCRGSFVQSDTDLAVFSPCPLARLEAPILPFPLELL